MKYNVRCCCQPQKVLGTLELPDHLRSGDRWCVMERRKTTIDAIVGPADPTADFCSSKHEIELREFLDPTRWDWGRCNEVAVYSDDRPIEFWRKIDGFNEEDKDGNGF